MYLISYLLFYKDRGVSTKSRATRLWWNFLGKVEDGFQLLKILRSYHTALEKLNISKTSLKYPTKRQVSLQLKENFI